MSLGFFSKAILIGINQNRVAERFGDPVFLQIFLTIAFGRRKGRPLAHVAGKLTPGFFAYAAMLVSTRQMIKCNALLTSINFKAFSVIDRYSEGERNNSIALNEANYGWVFDNVMIAINNLTGEAKQEFDRLCSDLYLDSLNKSADGKPKPAQKYVPYILQ